VRRELGWKAAHIVRELKVVAAAEAVMLASDASLKVMLSQWENGKRRPDAMHQRLLCKIYHRTAEDLGFEAVSGELIPRPAPTVNAAMVDYFRLVFEQHVRADNLMGPHYLVDVVRPQVDLLDRVLAGARDGFRLELLYLGCRYSEFTGWLYQDAGETQGAMRFSDHAMDYALEIGDTREMAYILMRKANIAIDSGRPDRAIGLTGAALRNTEKVSPRIRALILGQRGRAYAALGDSGECARALDQAQEDVNSSDDASGDIASYCTPPYISMESANCWSRLGQFDAAIEVFERGLANWPHEFRRDQGVCLARLANAYAGREDTDGACKAGTAAIDVVRSATSTRALQELQHLRVRLAPWRTDARVSDLSERIRSVVRPAQ
jgi:tetratricopeptide (TPR) repeat protein